jgi:WD40 repeat protein
VPTLAFLSVHCPACGAGSDRVPASLAGQTVRCSRCGARFPVPAPEDSPAPTILESAAEGAPSPTVLDTAAEPAATVAETPTTAPTVPEAAPAPAPTGAIAWQAGQTVLGLYEVAGILGEGGMGRVYKVRHRGWNLDLAVKVPLPSALEAAGGADLFEREAETWVNLGLHPHVVTCHYVRRVEGVPLVFAELMGGGSLHEAIRQRRLASVESILDVAIQLAWGLQHAHEQGLVHRDVKPANVLLDAAGLAKVTDFGLARARSVRLAPAAGSPAGHTLSVEGGGGGTPAYLSPEQARGETLSRRSDLWSFALCVLEAFLGARTWEYGLAAPEVLEDARRGPAPPGRPALPTPVADVLARCFREDPAGRPHDTAEVAATLRAAWEQVAGHAYPRRPPVASRGSADSLNNRAVSLVDLGRAPEAATFWRRALQAQPHHVEATYNGSLAEWLAGRIPDTELVRRMDESCASHASSPRAQQLRGRLHLLLSQGPEALAAFERAQSLGGSDDLERDLAAARAPVPPSPRALRGLPGPVTALALAPDGRTVLAASGREIRVWDAGTGQLLRVLAVSEGTVHALLVLPDGRFLLVGAENAPLTLFDLLSGRPARAWVRHTGHATCLTLGPGTNQVLSGGSDRILRLWDVESGHCLREMAGHEDAVTGVAASRSALVSASRDGTVRLWSPEDGRSLAVLRAHAGRALAVALCEPDSRLVSAGDDGVVRDWGLQSRALVRAYASHVQAVGALAAAPRGGRLLSGAADRSVRGFDLEAERLVTLAWLDAGVQALALAPDGTAWAAHGTAVSEVPATRLTPPPAALSRPASATEEAERTHEFESGLANARRSLGAGDLRTAVELARKARSVPGHERAEAALSLWDELSQRLPRQGLQSVWEEAHLDGHRDQVLSVAADGPGARAISGGLDATVRVWDLSARGPTATLSGHGAAVTAVSLAPDGGRAVSGSRDRTVRTWELSSSPRPLRVLEGHGETVTSVDTSPDGSRAVSASWDATVRVWDLERGLALHTLEGHAANVAAARFSSDGQVVASAGWDGRVRLWDALTGAALGTLEGHEGNVTAVAFHPSGRQVASGGEDRTVRIFDPRSRRCLRTFGGHEGEVTGIAFTPDGRFVLSSSRDDTVRIWDLRRGTAVRTLPHPAGVLALALAHRGCAVLTAGADASVRLWHLDWEPETAAADGIAATTSLGAETVRERLGPASPTVRATLREDLRQAAPRTPRVVPQAARAVRRVAWRRILLGLLAAAVVIASLVLARRPAPRLRLSPYMAGAVLSEVDLVDVDSYRAGCEPAAYADSLERLVSGNPEARDVACVAAASPPGVVAEVLDQAPLVGRDALESARLRRNAASALSALGGDGVADLCARLADDREEVRGVAAVVLGVSKDQEALTCLRETTSGGTGPAKQAAAAALRQQIARGGIDVVEGFALVSALLHDPDPEARLGGLRVVSLFSYSTADAAARALLDDADPQVAEAAARAVEAIDRIHNTDLLRGDTEP